MDSKLLETLIRKVGTPVFVYDEEKLRSNVERIFEAAKTVGLKDRIELFAAYFCNSNPHLFKVLSNYKAGILLQTEEEYHQVKKNRLKQNLMLSPSFLKNFLSRRRHEKSMAEHLFL